MTTEIQTQLSPSPKHLSRVSAYKHQAGILGIRVSGRLLTLGGAGQPPFLIPPTCSHRRMLRDPEPSPVQGRGDQEGLDYNDIVGAGGS